MGSHMILGDASEAFRKWGLCSMTMAHGVFILVVGLAGSTRLRCTIDGKKQISSRERLVQLTTSCPARVRGKNSRRITNIRLPRGSAELCTSTS
jgi:hypothetical protein